MYPAMYTLHPAAAHQASSSVYTTSNYSGYTDDSGYASNLSEYYDYTSHPPSPSSSSAFYSPSLVPPTPAPPPQPAKRPLFPAQNPRACFPLTQPWPYTYCSTCHNDFRMARKAHTAVSGYAHLKPPADGREFCVAFLPEGDRSLLFWLAVCRGWVVTERSGLPGDARGRVDMGDGDDGGKGKGRAKEQDAEEELGWVVYIYSCSPLGPYTNAVDLSIALTGDPDIQGIGIPKGAMWFKASPEDTEMRRKRGAEERITRGKFTEWIRRGECRHAWERLGMLKVAWLDQMGEEGWKRTDVVSTEFGLL
ncbi:hypothetical protein FPQ18DRAFT_393598 [Pyronema domesticum]|nr:hypothetical protein FPQ18DRAFT_393598 [Pyronema domesticum]